MEFTTESLVISFGHCPFLIFKIGNVIVCAIERDHQTSFQAVTWLYRIKIESLSLVNRVGMHVMLFHNWSSLCAEEPLIVELVELLSFRVSSKHSRIDTKVIEINPEIKASLARNFQTSTSFMEMVPQKERYPAGRKCSKSHDAVATLTGYEKTWLPLCFHVRVGVQKYHLSHCTSLSRLSMPDFSISSHLKASL